MIARSCTHVRADLSAYLDGELDAGLTEATRIHLEGCAACRSELRLLRLTVDALRRLPDLPPPAAILSGVRARLRPEPWYRRLFGAPWHFEFPLGAAATLLVVIGISLFVARYPELPKTPAPRPFPDSAAPPAAETQVQPAPSAPPDPAPRDKVAGRRSPAPSAPPASTASTAIAGADTRDRQRAIPAIPAEPVAPSDVPAVTSKSEQSQPALTEALERTFRLDDDSAGRPASGPTTPFRDSAVVDEIDGGSRTKTPSLAKQRESRAVFDQKADRGSGLGDARLEVGKEKAAADELRVVCLLSPGGDTVYDLERFLRLEGATDIEIRALETPAVREAFTRQRGRPGNLSEPTLGWTMTARIQAPALLRFLEALAGRTGLRILEQPAVPARTESPKEPLELRVTAFR